MGRTSVTFDSWGSRCAAWLYEPDGGSEEDRVPCVVMAHGFAGIKEAALAGYAERFARLGLAVLVFDYRNFGESEGEPRQLLDIGMQLADWAAAIAYARTLAGVDPERIALWGSSFSGGHVLRTAARDHRVAAVIAQAPFVDGIPTLTNLPPAQALKLTAAGLRDQFGALRGRAPFMLKAVGPPGSVAAMTSPDAEPGYRALIPTGVRWDDSVAARIALRLGLYRPIRGVGRIRCPVLYCVLDDDAVTPAAPAIDAARRTPDARLCRYPGGHFDIYVGAGFERTIADQERFLRETVLAGPVVVGRI